MVAIDFTASNMAPSDPKSLHYKLSGKLNEYERAIQAVGSILSNYDCNQLYPTYGFGGVPIWRGPPVSHAFALSENEEAPAVAGVQGIMNIYRQALTRV